MVKSHPSLKSSRAPVFPSTGSYLQPQLWSTLRSAALWSTYHKSIFTPKLLQCDSYRDYHSIDWSVKIHRKTVTRCRVSYDFREYWIPPLSFGCVCVVCIMNVYTCVNSCLSQVIIRKFTLRYEEKKSVFVAHRNVQLWSFVPTSTLLRPWHLVWSPKRGISIARNRDINCEAVKFEYI